MCLLALKRSSARNVLFTFTVFYVPRVFSAMRSSRTVNTFWRSSSRRRCVISRERRTHSVYIEGGVCCIMYGTNQRRISLCRPADFAPPTRRYVVPTEYTHKRTLEISVDSIIVKRYRTEDPSDRSPKIYRFGKIFRWLRRPDGRRAP